MVETDRNRALRYNISSWYQLPGCLSNNSKDLSLHVADFHHESEFRGIRITVEHNRYGTLFATIVNAEGYIVSPDEITVSSERAYNLPIDAILKEFEKFGFLITYNPKTHLSGNQLQYLMTLQKLKFDKIRILNTWTSPRGVKEFTTHFVAFKAEKMDTWLNSGYSPPESELTQAMLDGKAVDLTYIGCSKKFNWSWLDYVASIDDILRDNLDDSELYRKEGYYDEQSRR